jgi:hypothetical protein
MQRLVIHPKDVVVLDGVCYDTARRRLQAIRVALGKPSRAPITIPEYCRHYNLSEEEVRAALGKH